jgi:hypothetical protein
MKVTRVEVSALVVDAEGKPVRDLRADEVEIYDGGRKQDLQSFVAYTYHGGSIPLDTVDSPSDPNAATALVTNAWSSSSRVIGILIDDLHIDARRTQKAREAARYLVANLAPSDLLFVGLTSAPTMSTAGFVRDRRRALEIIDSFGGLRLPDPTLEMRQTPQTYSNPLLNGTRTPGLAASEQQRAMRLEDTYDAIGRIAAAVRDLAALTGGVSLVDTNDLGGAVDRVLRDASDYYVVSYEPDKEVKGSKIRPIEVRVKRPGVKVYTRKGYMPPPANPDTLKVPGSLSANMRTLLSGIVPIDALPMVVQMIAIGEHKGKTRYAVVTETAGGPLVEGIEGDRVSIEQAILSIDDNGKIANATQKKAELKVGPQQVEMLGALGLRTIWCIDLAPGIHQVRVATVDQRSGRGGSMYLDIAVEAGAPANAAALMALNQSPKPTAFVDPEAKKVMTP